MIIDRREMFTDSDESGFTLVELMVTMVIITVVMAITLTVMITVQDQTRDNQARSESVAQLRLALSTIDRQVRSGNVLYSPAGESLPGASVADQCQASGALAGSCMRVYTQSNGDQRCVQWQVLGDILRVRSWSVDWQTDPVSKVSAWRVAARDLTNLGPGPAVLPFELKDPGPAGNYSARVLHVQFRAKDPAQSGRDADLETSLTGRNTIYGYDLGICSPVPNA